MARVPEGRKFVLEGNTLTVHGELGPDDEKRYSDELFGLLNCGRYQLILDMTGLHYMSSSYIGATSLAVMIARQNKRTLTILANAKVARILNMTGIGAMTEVKAAGD